MSLRHGPLEVEIDADSEDDYQSELLEFIEEYEEWLEGLEVDKSAGELDEHEETESEKQASIDWFSAGETADVPNQDSSEAATD